MFKAYQRVLRLLRDKLPPAFPVNVRRVKMTSTKDGFCYKVDDTFQIRINRELPEAAAIDALLHEWAHARAWNHIHDAIDHDEFEKMAHDASWGVAYSEVYRIFEQLD